jgi:hypothetical protein
MLVFRAVNMDDKQEVLEQKMIFENFLKLFRILEIAEISEKQPAVFFQSNFGP